MAAFDAAGKRTAAVYVIEKSGETRKKYRREQYNLVSYNNDTQAEPKTYMEPLRQIALEPGNTAQDMIEYYDEVLFFDTPPFRVERDRP